MDSEDAADSLDDDSSDDDGENSNSEEENLQSDQKEDEQQGPRQRIGATRPPCFKACVSSAQFVVQIHKELVCLVPWLFSLLDQIIGQTLAVTQKAVLVFGTGDRFLQRDPIGQSKGPVF